MIDKWLLITTRSFPTYNTDARNAHLTIEKKKVENVIIV